LGAVTAACVAWVPVPAAAQSLSMPDIPVITIEADRLFGAMNERGASVILDRRAVFISADASDITASAIARIDELIGEGQPLDEIMPLSEGSGPSQQVPTGPVDASDPALGETNTGD